MNNFKKSIFRTSVETIVPPVSIEHLFSDTGHTNPVTACTFDVDTVSLYSLDAVLGIGSILYTDIALTTPFNGLGWSWHTGGLPGTAYLINNVGVVGGIAAC
jgi:hypothetical protein